jgi:hypothetical protein
VLIHRTVGVHMAAALVSMVFLMDGVISVDAVVRHVGCRVIELEGSCMWIVGGHRDQRVRILYKSFRRLRVL